MSARTPRQMVVAHDSKTQDRLYVLADDGTLWRLDDAESHRTGARGATKWRRLPVLPDRLTSLDAGFDDDEEDDGCPKGDPECLSRNDECHDACEPPR